MPAERVYDYRTETVGGVRRTFERQIRVGGSVVHREVTGRSPLKRISHAPAKSD